MRGTSKEVYVGMKKMTVAMICLVVATAAFGASGCGKVSTRDISVEETTSVLNQAVAYAQARDLEKLGDLAQDKSMTRTLWESAGGWETVPTEPPEIVDTYLLPTIYFKNGSWTTGGRVLVLEGINGLGKPYHTESLVFSAGSHGLAVGNVIYWDSAEIGQYNEDGSATTAISPSPEANQ
jgi:uncharacterized protein YceK